MKPIAARSEAYRSHVMGELSAAVCLSPPNNPQTSLEPSVPFFCIMRECFAARARSAGAKKKKKQSRMAFLFAEQPHASVRKRRLCARVS